MLQKKITKEEEEENYFRNPKRNIVNCYIKLAYKYIEAPH